MSFVVTTPDLVESAAADLASIRSSLSEAAATAAGPTTGIASAAQDEISMAVASIFGDFGQEFQALSAQAQAFHAQFVELMNTGAGVYAAAETANGQALLGGGVSGGIGPGLGGSAVTAIRTDANALSSAIVGAPAALLGASQTGARSISAPGLIGDFNTFANQVAGPYRALVGNTVGNLQTIAGTTTANPLPLLHQLATNQVGYGRTIATMIGTGIQHLPAELAHLPEGVQGLRAFNPAPYLQEFVSQQIGYAQTALVSVQNAAHDFGTGLAALPMALHAGFQSLLAGNVPGAVTDVGRGFLNLFFTGFDAVTGAGGVVTITPGGALGDLLPILSIPTQMAQNFTNFIPAGSIPSLMAQHATNVLATLTDTAVTSTVGLVIDPTSPIGIGVSINATMGLPLVLAIEALGGPASALNALGSSVTAFATAVQTGNASAAAAAILDAPAVVANGFLNGQTTLPLSLTVPLGGTDFPTTLNIPLDGILAPAAPYDAVVDGSALGIPGLTFNSTVTGTPLSGLIPGLLDYLPADLAAAIGGPPAPVIPPLSF